MPCRDYDDRPNTRVEYREDKTKVDRLTRLLCYTLTYLGKKSPGVLRSLLTNSRDLKSWWRVHQEQDERRIAAERAEANKKALKKKALAKLSVEERRVLGL